ncbi:MerR HTH family regulatory protein [Bradyrhizobium erythrophlei]|nr:MerR HTH family regulatory protein [Bradyrhizobium erythrophlei]
MARRESSSVVVSAFTEDHVERLTGVSQRQLRYWDRTGFFVPSLAYEDRRSPYSRLYSFRDIVSLKIVSALRNDANVPLPHLRDVKEKLAHLGDDLWATTTLYVLNRRVIFDSPDMDRREEVVSGQVMLQIPLKVVSGSTEEAVKALRKREDTAIGKIERRKNIAHNQAVIAGTRIPVRSVKAFADAGYSVEQIQKEYPTLTAEDIKAAIAFEAAAA